MVFSSKSNRPTYHKFTTALRIRNCLNYLVILSYLPLFTNDRRYWYCIPFGPPFLYPPLCLFPDFANLLLFYVQLKQGDLTSQARTCASTRDFYSHFWIHYERSDTIVHRCRYLESHLSKEGRKESSWASLSWEKTCSEIDRKERSQRRQIWVVSLYLRLDWELYLRTSLIAGDVPISISKESRDYSDWWIESHFSLPSDLPNSLPKLDPLPIDLLLVVENRLTESEERGCADLLVHSFLCWKRGFPLSQRQ